MLLTFFWSKSAKFLENRKNFSVEASLQLLRKMPLRY